MRRSQYKGVNYTKGKSSLKEYWCAEYTDTKTGCAWRKYTKSERDAALEYDKKMIELGKDPVNILKRKDNGSI